MTQNHSSGTGQNGWLQDLTWMNVGVGNCPGRNDVKTDERVLIVEQNHTELFPVGLAVGLDELADDVLGLPRVGQRALLEG